MKRIIYELIKKLAFIGILLFTTCNNGTICNHEWGDWILTSPTCTETGGLKRKCIVVDCIAIEIQGEETPLLGHFLGEWTQTTAPNCTEDGILTKSCIRQDCEYIAETRVGDSPLGHNMGEWKITEATVLENGRKDWTCKNYNCNHIDETQTIYTLATSYFQLITPGNDSYRVVRSNVEPPNVVYIPAEFNGLPVTEIGNSVDGPSALGAFSERTNITAIHMPDTIIYISYATFRGCTGLTSITIPEGVESINRVEPPVMWGMFSLANLTSITIPASVKTIDNRAFIGCRNLININVHEDNPNYASEGGMLLNKTKTTLIAFPSASGDVMIPASVTSITEEAFYNCINLTSVTFHENVSSVFRPFGGCINLISINVHENNPRYISENGILYDTYKDGYPSGIKTSLIKASPAKEYGIVTIPESVTNIADYAFSGCNFTEVIIPASVNTIGWDAFPSHTITSVTFLGTISADRFSRGNGGSFHGILRDKYLEEGPGTYITDNPSDRYDAIWIKL